MNNILCEREDQTAAAVRNATVDRETALHAQRCPACSEILLVAEFLCDRSTLTDRERTVLPDAAPIWKHHLTARAVDRRAAVLHIFQIVHRATR